MLEAGQTRWLRGRTNTLWWEPFRIPSRAVARKEARMKNAGIRGVSAIAMVVIVIGVSAANAGADCNDVLQGARYFQANWIIG